MKKFLSVFLVALMIFTALPTATFNLTASAQTDGYYRYGVDNGEATILGASSSISGDITIPSTLGGYSVTKIGNGAFEHCSSLTSVIIPNSVTSIGYWAFYGCSSLKSITIPNSVTSMGDDVFYGCSSLTSVTIPNSVLYIGWKAFFGCRSLTSVTISSSVLYIGSGTFEGCSSLTSVTIPNSVTSISYDAFKDCSSLISINVDSENQNYSSEDGVLFNKDKTELICCPGGKSGEYVIPDSVLDIGYKAFYGCGSLISVTIPNSVTVLSIGMFEHCGSLTSVIIPDSVTTIGEGAFVYCRSLTSITIPNNVSNIGNWAFACCSSLTFATIPDSVTSIGTYVFAGCSSLTSIIIPMSVTSISKDAFNGCDNLTTIYGYSGSAAEFYALGKEIEFVSLVCTHKNTTVHSAKESTCQVKGNNEYITCNNCGEVISGSNAELPLANHKYQTTTTKATLTKNGCIVKKCSVCGDVASTTVIFPPSDVSIAATTYTYTGKVINPVITVKAIKGKTIKKGTDYTISYASGRKNVGKYKVTVNFKGNYSGTKTFYFTINPVKTNVSKLTAGKKSIKVAIAKKSTQVTGYEVQYSTYKNFKSAKIKTISGYKTTSTTLTKLSAKKTYYVRVRTYKTVGKTKYYSAWSAYKSTKTR